MRSLVSLAMAALAATALGQQEPASNSGPRVNLTAISAEEGESTLECWQLDTRVKSAPGAGSPGPSALALGDLSGASYSVLPAGFDGGLHNAPSRQFVLFASGLVHITLPHSGSDAWIEGGKYGLIVAVDTPDVSRDGHRLECVGPHDTASLQMPLRRGDDFKYEVLHRGACSEAEMAGL